MCGCESRRLDGRELVVPVMVDASRIVELLVIPPPPAAPTPAPALARARFPILGLPLPATAARRPGAPAPAPAAPPRPWSNRSVKRLTLPVIACISRIMLAVSLRVSLAAAAEDDEVGCGSFEGVALADEGDGFESDGRCERRVERERSGTVAVDVDFEVSDCCDAEEENESGRGSFDGDGPALVEGTVRAGVGWTNSIVGVCGDAGRGGGDGVRRRGGGLVGVAFESVTARDVETSAVAASSCDFVMASSSFRSVARNSALEKSRGKMARDRATER